MKQTIRIKVLNFLEEKFNLKVKKAYPRYSIVFAKEYFKDNPNLVAAEIGVLRGSNSLSILKSLNLNHLFLIDPFIENGFEEKICYKRLSNFPNITYIKKKSDIAVSEIKCNLNFIYIDGDHFYNTFKKDIEDYWELLEDGGIIAGHYFERKDIARGVIEFVNKNNLEFEAKGSDWWIIKKQVNVGET